MDPVAPREMLEVDDTWLENPHHHAWLREDAERQLRFFLASLKGRGRFAVLDHAGQPIPGPQELHTTTRLIHSYSLGLSLGFAEGADMVDAGMGFVWRAHRDAKRGGFFHAVRSGVADGTKKAYGHMFVLLAAASAKRAGHPEADRLLADVAEVLEQRFWDEGAGLFVEDWSEDWAHLDKYRGMNANMHATEAHLAAYEATGEALFLVRAGRLIDVFIRRIAPRYNWRIPEHYSERWEVDRGYEGDPVFRPAGTTPGHSVEWARLVLQYWDLRGRVDEDLPEAARCLVEEALRLAWGRRGGFVYTLDFDGQVDRNARYWWPVCEGIGAISALLKTGTFAGEEWYRRLWAFAAAHLVDQARGGWYPELGADDRPVEGQFKGKPDIYHALQADLLPLAKGVSRLQDGLEARLKG
ncbi:AGE family epimerase/isomerase (plasmid) [Thioclava litoralis]|uniref:AGE family epimerase/isomerase n=1 Tax=Thioclava litoralis TaxID=3076557 RepID=A0ABZ1E3Y6_9RHOB|nr:AGE family epimerase/isomerase [Thioclava sp. FTW29]